MSEQQLKQTVSALDLRRAQLENLSQQQELIRGSIDEHLRAKETLENYLKINKEDELLVPVGAGVFIKTRTGDQKEAMSGIGSGIVVEQDIQEIVKHLDEQLEQLRRSAQELAAQAEKISGAVEELTRSAQQQYEALQRGASADGS
ncbi:MAG TPA: prefoldin subunit alpha [Euryarchaeota archaeon]|nr:prefoldin subunit alpha [Euryarchaeota archaeon]